MKYKLLIFFVGIGLFVTSVLFIVWENQVVAAGFLIACGTLVAAFNRSMFEVQHYIAETRFAPISLKEARPFTFILWGVGITIVGLIWLGYGMRLVI